jgi:hypothetical protein
MADETAVSELPRELRSLVIRYVENMREGQEIRSSLSTEMTRTGLRWWDIDEVARTLS